MCIRDSFTVDQVSAAYAVLSDPRRRAEYDSGLLKLGGGGRADQQPGFQTGVENVDLDDLDFDGGGGGGGEREWYRDCRCGNPRGYRVREADLEEAADYGELMVGCQDCSLWLRVHFSVVDDDDDDDDNDDGDDVEKGNGNGDGDENDQSSIGCLLYTSPSPRDS